LILARAIDIVQAFEQALPAHRVDLKTMRRTVDVGDGLRDEIDRQGRPLTDPNRADEGFLLPIGGHKGYGLALIVGLLAGTLQGASMGKDVVDFNKDHVTPTNTGQAILVIDLKAFGEPGFFKGAVDQLIKDLRASERLPGVERVWLPGEQSHAKRLAYTAQGIPLAPVLVADLKMLATELSIAPLAV